MGRDKAWLPLGAGETMLQRVVRLLREVVPGENVAVVAAVDQQLPPLPPQTQLLRDEQPEGGPLPALVLGLGALAGRIDVAFAAAGDAPLIRPEFVEAMFRQLETARNEATAGAEILAAAPRDAGHGYPLAAAYHSAIEPSARRLIGQGAKALHQLLAASNVRWIEAERLRHVDPELVSLLNCNTPEQYEAARKLVDG